MSEKESPDSLAGKTSTAEIIQTATTMNPVSSIIDSSIRFLALYFTTLFSLDTYNAAANSPYGVLDGRPMRIPQPRDYGEGPRRGYRIDPGGGNARNGGFGGAGNDVDIGWTKACGACGPTIS